MNVRRGLGGLAWCVLLGSPAAAHQVSSPTENNRYAKITALPDAVRISYTVLFGEQPGAMERRRMDANRDGQIDDAEKRAYAGELAKMITPSLEVTLDGKPPDATWAVADLGLGLPIVNAGSFALDLVLVAPLPDPSLEEHELYFEDRWPVPNPGETDVKVEESPGCRLLESHVRRDARGIQKAFTFKGAGAAVGDRGILVRYGVDAELRGKKAVAKGDDSTVRRFAPLVLVLVLATFVGLGALARRRRR